MIAAHKNVRRHSGLRLIRIALVAMFAMTPGLARSEDAKTSVSQADLMKRLSPQGRVWLTKELAKARRDPAFTEATARAVVSTTNWAILGSMPEGDIEAIAFLVLMQASKSAQEDVRGVMAGVKAINDKKKKQRESVQALKGQKGKLQEEARKGLSDCPPQCGASQRINGKSAIQASKLQSDPHPARNLKPTLSSTLKTNLLVVPTTAKTSSGTRR
jgi:hypothetical protein